VKGGALALALVLATLPTSAARADSPDGGTAEAPYRECVAKDPPVAVDGGYFVSNQPDRRVACIIADCEKERDLLREQQGGGPTWQAVVLIVAGGFLAGYFTDRLLRK
jgi:hypothetical protein